MTCVHNKSGGGQSINDGARRCGKVKGEWGQPARKGRRMILQAVAACAIDTADSLLEQLGTRGSVSLRQMALIRS